MDASLSVPCLATCSPDFGPEGGHDGRPVQPRGASRPPRRRPRVGGPRWVVAPRGGRTPEGGQRPLTSDAQDARSRRKWAPGPSRPLAAWRQRLRGCRAGLVGGWGSQTVPEVLCRRHYPGDLSDRCGGSGRPQPRAPSPFSLGGREMAPYGERVHAEALEAPVGQLGGPLAFVAAVVRGEGERELRSLKSRALPWGGGGGGRGGNWEAGTEGPAGRKECETRPPSASGTAPAAGAKGRTCLRPPGPRGRCRCRAILADVAGDRCPEPRGPRVLPSLGATRVPLTEPRSPGLREFDAPKERVSMQEFLLPCFQS